MRGLADTFISWWSRKTEPNVTAFKDVMIGFSIFMFYYVLLGSIIVVVYLFKFVNHFIEGNSPVADFIIAVSVHLPLLIGFLIAKRNLIVAENEEEIKEIIKHEKYKQKKHNFRFKHFYVTKKNKRKLDLLYS